LEGARSVRKPYGSPTPTAYLLYDKKIEKRLNDKFEREYLKKKGSHQRPFNLRTIEDFSKEKIFIRQSDIRVTATYSKDVVFCNYSLFCAYLKENKINISYVLAILNSKLITYYALQKGIINLRPGKTPQLRSGQRGPIGIRQLPIYVSSGRDFNGKHNLLTKYAQRMLDLNNQLQSVSENTNRWYKLKDEVEKLDKQIDQLVYKLYNLTPEEIEIVEGGEKSD